MKVYVNRFEEKVKVIYAEDGTYIACKIYPTGLAIKMEDIPPAGAREQVEKNLEEYMNRAANKQEYRELSKEISPIWKQTAIFYLQQLLRMLARSNKDKDCKYVYNRIKEISDDLLAEEERREKEFHSWLR